VEASPEQLAQQEQILAKVAANPDLVDFYRTTFAVPNAVKVFNDITTAVEAEVITRWKCTKVALCCGNC
jgi:hypothetical protein